MSRIGKKPVGLPSGVSASVSGQTIEVKGPKATRSFTAADDVTITVNENNVSVEPRGKSKRARQQWGMSRTMISNMVTGVSSGFKKELEINALNQNQIKLKNEIEVNQKNYEKLIDEATDEISSFVERANLENLS